jgi:hypothetical protein
VGRIVNREAVLGIATALILVAGLGLASLHAQNANAFDRFKSGGYLNGLAWIAMSSEEKATFLLGFDEGVRAGAGRAVYHKWLEGEQQDKLVAELLVRERPGVDPTVGIDRIYNDHSNLRLPIVVVYQAAKLNIDGTAEDRVQMFLREMRKVAAQ